MKKGFKILMYIVGIVFIIMILIMLIVPPIARNYVQNHSIDLIGRQVTIKHIGLNLFTTTLTINDLCVKEDDAETDFVQLEHFKIRLGLLKLLSNTLDIKKLHIDGLSVAVMQDSAGFNFDDIITHFAADSTSLDTTPEVIDSTAKMLINIHDIRLKNSKISYLDDVVGSSFNLKNINVAIPALHFGGGAAAGGIDLNFDEGGYLSIKLNMDMDKSDFDVHIALEQFNLASTLPYLLSVVDAGKLEGMLSTDLQIVGNLNNILQTNVSGTVDVTNFILADSAMQNVVTIDRSLVDIEVVNVDSLYFHVNKLLLKNAITNAEIEQNGTINLLNMLVLVDGKNETDTVAQKPQNDTLPHRKPILVVDTVDFTGLAVNFTDKSQPQPFHYSISDISVQTQNFTLDTENETVISSKVGETGQLDCKVKMNISKLPNINISIRTANISLPEFSPYTSSLMAHNIIKGNMSFVSQTIIDNKQLTGVNKVEIVKCEVEKDASVTKPIARIPLKTALYLIKDKNDRIDIDLPVKGRIDSPSFSYWKIVWKTFVNMMLKVAASPFNAVGNAVGISGKTDYSQIVIDAMLPDVGAEQYQTLNEIADMLAQKPDLQLTMIQKINLSDAIKRQIMFNLKRDSYLFTHTDKNAENLEIIDIEAIMAMSDNDLQIAQYVHSVDSTASVSDFSERYTAQAQLQLKEKATKRESAVKQYLTERKNIDVNRLNLSILPDSELSTYKGKDCFTIEAGLK